MKSAGREVERIWEKLRVGEKHNQNTLHEKKFN